MKRTIGDELVELRKGYEARLALSQEKDTFFFKCIVASQVGRWGIAKRETFCRNNFQALAIFELAIKFKIESEIGEVGRANTNQCIEHNKTQKQDSVDHAKYKAWGV